MDFSLTTPVLDQDCWPALPQALLNEAFEKTRGQLADLTGVIASSTTPDPSDRDKLWIKLESPNGPPIGQFFYGGGDWLWPYDGDTRKVIKGERMLWVGNSADIPTLGGGTAGVTTVKLGAFWEIDTLFEGRSPIGVGAIPDAIPAKSITSEENYGEGAHLQLEEEVGPHGHGLPTLTDAMRTTLAPGSGSNNDDSISGAGFMGLATFSKIGDVTQVGMPIIHPVRGIYFLKRTIRIWMTG